MKTNVARKYNPEIQNAILSINSNLND